MFTKKEKERIRVNLMNKYDEITEQEGTIEFLKLELENAKESAAVAIAERETSVKEIQNLRHAYQTIEVQRAVLQSDSDRCINELEKNIENLREENKLLREIREMDIGKIRDLQDKISSIQHSMVVLEEELHYTITSGSDEADESCGEGINYRDNRSEQPVLNYSSPFVTNPLQPYVSSEDHDSIDPIKMPVKLSNIVQKIMNKLSCFNNSFSDNILGEGINVPDPEETKKARADAAYDSATLSKELIESKIKVLIWISHVFTYSSYSLTLLLKMANMDIEHEELKSNYRRLEHVVCSLKLEIAELQAEVDCNRAQE